MGVGVGGSRGNNWCFGRRLGVYCAGGIVLLLLLLLMLLLLALLRYRLVELLVRMLVIVVVVVVVAVAVVVDGGAVMVWWAEVIRSRVARGWCGIWAAVERVVGRGGGRLRAGRVGQGTSRRLLRQQCRILQGRRRVHLEVLSTVGVVHVAQPRWDRGGIHGGRRTAHSVGHAPD